MAARIIDGKAVAARVRAEVKEGVAAFEAETGRRPGLATILVGDDPASAVYVGGKQKACAEVGITGFDVRPPGDGSQEAVAGVIEQCNDDEAVSGILLQLPVGDHLDGTALVELIDAGKDVDGLTAASAGLLAQGSPGLRPCTPSGVIRLLDDAGVDIEGAEAVVVGRSMLVGKPLAQLLLERNATVTICHSRTRDLAEVTRRADILCVAAGRPHFIGSEHVRYGAVVIDVGMHRLEDGLTGDVDYEAVAPLASAITPVPGGVGPMTIAMLLANTLAAARAASDS